MLAHSLSLLAVFATSARAIVSYANEFVDPAFLLDKTQWQPLSLPAQIAIVKGADLLAAQGPWGMHQNHIAIVSLGLSSFTFNSRNRQDGPTTF